MILPPQIHPDDLSRAHARYGHHEEQADHDVAGLFAQSCPPVFPDEGPDDPVAEARREGFQMASDAFLEVLRWLAQSNSPQSMGLRVYSLLGAVRPDLLDGLTHTQVARKFKISKQALSKYTAEIVTLTQGRFSHGDGCSYNRRRAARQRNEKPAQA